MAYNYIQFSFALNGSVREYDWLRKEVDEQVCDDNENVQYSGIRVLIDRSAAARRQYNFKNVIVVYSEESADPYDAAVLVQKMLKKFRPGKKAGVGFCWSATCSKPRPDEFGGGACYVTEDKIYLEGTYALLQRMQRHVNGNPRLATWEK